YLLVERFLSLLSFIFGQKLSAAHIQPTTMKNGQYSTILPVTRRTQTPNNKVLFPDYIKDIKLSEEIFSALSWFRRGIAERDPIETYSAFMVCLQILARISVPGKAIKTICPHCGEVLSETEQSITSLVRELVTHKLGASKSMFNKIWKARNAIIAHGNAPITPQTLLELTELKFEAGQLALEGIKLSFGIPKAEPPFLTQSFFITDAFMYVD
ncbi:unnamed protein product, partial [marine sediment metagenome]